MVEVERSQYEAQIAELQKQHICLSEQLEITRQKNRDMELKVANLEGQIEAFTLCVTSKVTER